MINLWIVFLIALSNFINYTMSLKKTSFLRGLFIFIDIFRQKIHGFSREMNDI